MFYNDFVTSKKSSKVLEQDTSVKQPQSTSAFVTEGSGTRQNPGPAISAEEFKQFKKEVQRSFQEIKLECKGIREKLTAVGEATLSSTLPQEQTSLKHIHEIKEEFQKLQVKIQEVGSLTKINDSEARKTNSGDNKGSLQLESPEQFSGSSFSSEFSGTVPDFPQERRSLSQVSFLSTGLRPGVSTPSLNSLEVEPVTKLEEEHQKYLSNKVEDVRGSLQVSLNGSSMQGKTIFEIAAVIPTYKHSFAVQITNLMDTPLVDLESCDHGGVMNVPDVIPALEIHALTFGTSKGANSWGVFTYRIHKTDLRLIVYYSAYSKTTIALAPADVVIDHNLCIYMSKQDISDWSTRPDKRGARVSSKEVCLSVSLSNLLARATISGRGQVIMKLEILKTELPALPPLSFRSEESSIDSSLEEDDSNTSLPGDVGYIIDITNSVQMDLVDPQGHLEDSSSTLPPRIGALRKRTLHFNIDSMDDMIVTYRIGSLDLRLAVAFGSDSQFSLSILPASIPIDSALLAAMCDSPQWKTRPDLRTGFADEGETTVCVRNFRATAALTVSGKVPILKLSVISTN